MQYFNWIEYDFMIPPKPKTASAMVVAMISNCGPRKRLDYLQELMDEGVIVHSYGACLNNMVFYSKKILIISSQRVAEDR
jgi:hypothetical protein